LHWIASTLYLWFGYSHCFFGFNC